MIDYFFKWPNEAAAKADALALARFLTNQGQVSPDIVREWLRDHVLPDVKAWRPSQDTPASPDVGGVIHNYLTGWFAIVAVDQPMAVLTNATALAFALDRDGPPYIIKNNIAGIITDIAVSPIFAGSHYPIGGYS